MDKLSMAIDLTNGEATENVMMAKLAEAEYDIMHRLDPLGAANLTELPPKYDMLAVKLAVRRFYKMGAEGEITHNENGVNRTYGSADDEDLLRAVMPYAKVM